VFTARYGLGHYMYLILYRSLKELYRVAQHSLSTHRLIFSERGNLLVFVFRNSLLQISSPRSNMPILFCFMSLPAGNASI